jgi:hypothetical protein
MAFGLRAGCACVTWKLTSSIPRALRYHANIDAQRQIGLIRTDVARLAWLAARREAPLARPGSNAALDTPSGFWTNQMVRPKRGADFVVKRHSHFSQPEVKR